MIEYQKDGAEEDYDLESSTGDKKYDAKIEYDQRQTCELTAYKTRKKFFDQYGIVDQLLSKGEFNAFSNQEKIGSKINIDACVSYEYKGLHFVQLAGKDIDNQKNKCQYPYSDVFIWKFEDIITFSESKKAVG